MSCECGAYAVRTAFFSWVGQWVSTVKKVRCTFTVSSEILEQFKSLVKNVSGELEDLMRQRIAELTGRGVGSKASEYRVVREHFESVSSQYSRARKLLEEQNSVLYMQGSAVLDKVGVAEDFSNVTELISKFTSQWTEERGFMRRYITLAELAQGKFQLERRLSEMRLAKTANQRSTALFPTTALVPTTALPSTQEPPPQTQP